MHSILDLTQQATLIVMPWPDPATERAGHDPRSRYVELFVLPVLGPSSTWLLRRLVDGLDSFPDGYELDLAETARALGLSLTPDRTGPFTRAFHRCMMFGYVQPTAYGVGVRRMVSTLLPRQLERLPAHLRALHADYTRRQDPAHTARARHCAQLLAGQCSPADLERVLVALGHSPAIATRVASERRVAAPPAA